MRVEAFNLWIRMFVGHQRCGNRAHLSLEDDSGRVGRVKELLRSSKRFWRGARHGGRHGRQKLKGVEQNEHHGPGCTIGASEQRERATRCGQSSSASTTTECKTAYRPDGLNSGARGSRDRSQKNMQQESADTVECTAVTEFRQSALAHGRAHARG